MIVSSVMFLISARPVLLILGRVIAGAAEGIIFTVGLALIVDTVGQDEIGAWIGLAFLGLDLGLFIGPLVGGVIYEKAGYRSVFWTLLALTVLALGFGFCMIERKVAAGWMEENTDHRAGYGTMAAVEAAPKAVDAKSQHSAGSHAEGLDPSEPISHDPDTTASDQAVPAAKTQPIVWKLLKSSRFVTSIYGSFVIVVIFTGIESIVPLFASRIFNWNSATTGVAFLCMTAPTVASPVVGWISDRFGARSLVVSASAVTAVSLALLTLVQQKNVAQIVVFCILLTFIGEQADLAMLAPWYSIY